MGQVVIQIFMVGVTEGVYKDKGFYKIKIIKEQGVKNIKQGGVWAMGR